MTQQPTSFESASLGTSTLLVRKLDENKQEKTVEYTLVMDFNAVAKAQEHLGRDLSDVKQWEHLTGSDTTVVCWCAFDRFHPEVELREVRQMLAPAQAVHVANMLLEMCFPGILQRIEEHIKEKREREEQGDSPAPSPTIARKP